MGKINLYELREMRDFWNPVNESALDGEKRTIFLTRKRAVDLYIDGISPKIIAEQTKLPTSEIHRFTKMCLKRDENGKMLGYTSLIPYKRINAGDRKLERLFFLKNTLG